ncbi:tetraacyldisaccharide 4'-kinase [Lichenicoccus roseus]|uniref:Tetraacyldisaccharide 4'-kinase n=1 Tax=Lichenicoccus roseus TaxID=2683649 RepID=A0A5R9J8Y0_9PROT|nr:tetraacyldisaccharide 4'-kinase [Lichenicoccus roseus]TLU71826.1 tetraacyldisaccharide 4'-kinase [Lichenicoccus roseus]
MSRFDLRPPAFWFAGQPGLAACLLWPAARVTAAITRRRIARPGWRAPVPVICCGNLSAGGTGKTTLALDLLARLKARGVAVHALTRGYRGTASGVLRVDPERHDATLVGDEPLLLAAVAPTWVGADRAASARAAIAAGAGCLLMDDGMQNPTLVQDCTLVVIDGATGFGNGRVLPAGPLREPVEAGTARARAAVLIGPDRRGAATGLPPGLPVLRAGLAMAPEAAALRGTRLLAFAGIGRPGKFFDALRALDLELVAAHGFPNHHPYRPAELARLRNQAHALGARLVTTPKDAVRLPAAFRRDVTALGVGLLWADPAVVETLLDEVLEATGTVPRTGKPRR